MLRLFNDMEKLKQEREKSALLVTNGTTPPAKAPPTAAELRIQKEIKELKFLKDCTEVRFPNGEGDLMAFEVNICPDEAPNVKCKTKVLNPNIDTEGNVGLNILRGGIEWRPVMDITTVIYGLYHLFLVPNHEHYLNKEAATLLRNDPSAFEDRVQNAIPKEDLFGSFFIPKRKRSVLED